MYKLKTWCREEWNTFSLINDVAIIISMILRFSLPQEYFFYARIAFTMTLILHIMRFLESLFISEDLGPKVIMIRRMVCIKCTTSTFNKVLKNIHTLIIKRDKYANKILLTLALIQRFY